MKTLLANFLPRGGRSSSKQGHFAKNDSLLVGNTFPNPCECSADAAVLGVLWLTITLLNDCVSLCGMMRAAEFTLPTQVNG